MIAEDFGCDNFDDFKEMLARFYSASGFAIEIFESGSCPDVSGMSMLTFVREIKA